jgi:predicted extracellular nuclease
METKQFGKEEMFKRPSDSKSIPLNDRPPFLLRASIKKRDKTFTFTVVANHLKSLRGYFDKDGNTRAKKKLQAEYLARWIQSRQTANPNEPLILVGDFNAFQFNDGVVDVIGTLKGKPAPKEQVMMPTEDLVNPDLINLVDFIPREQRYSYVFAGNAQVLDHFLVNEVAKKHAVRFGYSRANADFPESYRNDPNRPERISDHDAPIGYFSIDEVPQAATPNAANQPAPK